MQNMETGGRGIFEGNILLPEETEKKMTGRPQSEQHD
jgi:hypothetical protein